MEMEIYKMFYKKGKNSNNLRILGEDFAKNNKNKGKLIINNKKIALENYIYLEEDKLIKIKMVLSKNIYNKSRMYKNCETLEKLSLLSFDDDIKQLQNVEKNIEIEFNRQNMKDEEESFSSNNSIYDDNLAYKDDFPLYNNIKIDDFVFSEISKKNDDETSELTILYLNKKLNYSGNNHTILNEMFYNCKLLSALPDVYNWNIDNVIDISGMFYNCMSLFKMEH